MTIKELQTWVHDDWKNHSVDIPSTSLQLLYLIEEFGEVAEGIRTLSNHKSRNDTSVDLGSEFADLLISVVTLANTYQVDLASEIEQFKKRLAQRRKQTEYVE